MPHWKHKIDVGGFYHDDELSVRRKGILLAGELRKHVLPWYEQDDELKDLIESFEDISDVGEVIGDDVMTQEWAEDEFNTIMADLYDWADYDHRLWINTWGKTDG